MKFYFDTDFFLRPLSWYPLQTEICLETKYTLQKYISGLSVQPCKNITRWRADFLKQTRLLFFVLSERPPNIFQSIENVLTYISEKIQWQNKFLTRRIFVYNCINIPWEKHSISHSGTILGQILDQNHYSYRSSKNHRNNVVILF